jgi:hypothetical protein
MTWKIIPQNWEWVTREWNRWRMRTQSVYPEASYAIYDNYLLSKKKQNMDSAQKLDNELSIMKFLSKAAP